MNQKNEQLEALKIAWEITHLLEKKNSSFRTSYTSLAFVLCLFFIDDNAQGGPSVEENINDYNELLLEVFEDLKKRGIERKMRGN